MNDEVSSPFRQASLDKPGTGKSLPLEFGLSASDDSPVVNPAFVIKNWGDADANLKINDKEINRGKKFRFGHRHTLEGSDLIVWIKAESAKPVQITLSPVAG